MPDHLYDDSYEDEYDEDGAPADLFDMLEGNPSRRETPVVNDDWSSVETRRQEEIRNVQETYRNRGDQS